MIDSEKIKSSTLWRLQGGPHESSTIGGRWFEQLKRHSEAILIYQSMNRKDVITLVIEGTAQRKRAQEIRFGA